MLECPFCESNKRVSRLVTKTVGVGEYWAHVYLCDSCKEPFMTVEAFMPKEEIKKKGKNYGNGHLPRM